MRLLHREALGVDAVEGGELDCVRPGLRSGHVDEVAEQHTRPLDAWHDPARHALEGLDELGPRQRPQLVVGQRHRPLDQPAHLQGVAVGRDPGIVVRDGVDAEAVGAGDERAEPAAVGVRHARQERPDPLLQLFSEDDAEGASSAHPEEQAPADRRPGLRGGAAGLGTRVGAVPPGCSDARRVAPPTPRRGRPRRNVAVARCPLRADRACLRTGRRSPGDVGPGLFAGFVSRHRLWRRRADRFDCTLTIGDAAGRHREG